MNRVRKGIVYLLSLFLLVFLIGTAVSTSSNQTVGKPKQVETYLSQSKLYDHFIAYTTDQAKKSNGDTDLSGSVSLSDAAVQSAAQSAFPPALIQQSINTFINSNYAWLEGKTDTRQFKIDLSSQKQTFAEKVGQYVKTYTAGLPVCASTEAALQQSGDPLAATCRPSVLTPEAAGAEVTQRLSTTGDFLSNPVVTASSINPKGNPQATPYYSKLSRLPTVYRVGTKLPYIFGILSILSAIGIIFISFGKRKGVRRVGIVLLIAGVALVILKFAADYTFKKAEHRLFNNSDVGQLQQSLTDFLHRIESAMVRIDLWFGIAFLLLAAVIFGILAATRHREDKPKNLADLPDDMPEPTDDAAPLILSRKRLKRPVENLTPVGRPVPREPTATPAPKPKRPPRLVQ